MAPPVTAATASSSRIMCSTPSRPCHLTPFAAGDLDQSISIVPHTTKIVIGARFAASPTPVGADENASARCRRRNQLERAGLTIAGKQPLAAAEQDRLNHQPVFVHQV